MRRWLLLVLASLLSACIGQSTSGLRPPPPSDPATGPMVRELRVDETAFFLHDEGGGCLALHVEHPGLQPTVERSCFRGQQVLAQTVACGWPEEAEQGPYVTCPLQLPQVLYGQVVQPEIGYVCVGMLDGTGGAEGVIGARFIPFDGDGFILEASVDGIDYNAHLFTAEGIVYGEPPLDAPSTPIYELCEAQAPWGEKGLEYAINLEITIPGELRRQDTVILVDAGTGEMGVAGNATEGEEVVITVRAVEGDDDLRVAILRDEIITWESTYPWPAEVADILKSGQACQTEIWVRLDVRGDGAELSYLSDSCH